MTLSAPDEVQMKLRHSLLAVRAAVHHKTKPGSCNIETLSKTPRDDKEMSNDRSILFGDIGHSRNSLLRNHEEMNGCYRIDVPNCDAVLVLVENVSRILPPYDFVKNGIHSLLLSEFIPHSAIQN